jgi:hypothetical protein
MKAAEVGLPFSRDGGITWQQPKAGLDRRYGWACAADPERPEIWYVSASPMPSLLRGQFEPPAHTPGKANAAIYRSAGGAPWENWTAACLIRCITWPTPWRPTRKLQATFTPG